MISSYNSSQLQVYHHNYKMHTIISFMLQMKALKFWETKELAQGNTASKLQSLKLNPYQLKLNLSSELYSILYSILP